MTATTTDQTSITKQPDSQSADLVKMNPNKPIGNASVLRSLLDNPKIRQSMVDILPQAKMLQRMQKLVLLAANRQPQILQCTQASVIECVLRAAELGLEIGGTTGEAYILPFNNKIKGGGERGEDIYAMQATFLPGYRGLAKLARQSGEIKRIDADVVFEHDEFTYRKGTEFILDFRPSLDADRGRPIGAYALVEFKDGGLQADFMPYEDIEKIRKRSKSGSDSNGNAIGAWKSDWPEMAKKTVFRRVAKWLPLSAEKFQIAVELDNNATNIGILDDVNDMSTLPPGKTKSSALLDQIRGTPTEIIDQETGEVADNQPQPTTEQISAADARKDELKKQAADMEAQAGAQGTRETDMANPSPVAPAAHELEKMLCNKWHCPLEDAVAFLAKKRKTLYGNREWSDMPMQMIAEVRIKIENGIWKVTT